MTIAMMMKMTLKINVQHNLVEYHQSKIYLSCCAGSVNYAITVIALEYTTE